MWRRSAIDVAAVPAVPAVALLWVGLYHLNDWMFAVFEEGRAANWIFLPAGLRLIAVLVLGWRGVLGLWLGAVATTPNAAFFEDAWSWESVTGAAAAALAPWLAVAMTRGRLDLRPDLSGLRAADLVLLSIVCAICSALLNSTYLLWHGFDLAAVGSPVTMFVGNVVGTFVVLYLFKMAIAVLARAR